MLFAVCTLTDVANFNVPMAQQHKSIFKNMPKFCHSNVCFEMEQWDL